MLPLLICKGLFLDVRLQDSSDHSVVSISCVPSTLVMPSTSFLGSLLGSLPAIFYSGGKLIQKSEQHLKENH